MSVTTRFIEGAFDRFIASKIRSKGYVDMIRYLHQEKGSRCCNKNIDDKEILRRYYIKKKHNIDNRKQFTENQLEKLGLPDFAWKDDLLYNPLEVNPIFSEASQSLSDMLSKSIQIDVFSSGDTAMLTMICSLLYCVQTNAGITRAGCLMKFKSAVRMSSKIAIRTSISW